MGPFPGLSGVLYNLDNIMIWFQRRESSGDDVRFNGPVVVDYYDFHPSKFE